MRLTLKAELVRDHGNEIEVEIKGLKHIAIDGVPELKMMDPETGITRPLTIDEERDLEQHLEDFCNTRLARAIAPFLRRS
jgi:hypothetical protein